ncbi:MAG TPA: cob(I)yrinic acid a,c-diamide adenosyltransferase [Nitrospirae bacterium]|nr:cob(I)yrinic acid a,c-diamide adenosyltransferase [Nitrospirota bacterium]
MDKKGCIHVYTGDGKGKTTASIGLAIRAIGAGYKVLFVQFIKNKLSSEHMALKKLSPQIEVRQYGFGFIYGNNPSPLDKEIALKGIRDIKEEASKGEYDLIILDEANVALHYNLFPLDELLAVIDNKHPNTELVLTGRYAHSKIIDKADLVTEMKEIKHYFQKGIKARKGIEE